ncbi:MAG: hypothetical protein ACI8PW_000887 [Methylophilaceae bacterium]|jgi:uncharacterized protein YchJ
MIARFFRSSIFMLKNKYPLLYDALQTFYKQDRAAVKVNVRLSKKAPCPCGSGKRYKHYCLKHPFALY